MDEFNEETNETHNTETDGGGNCDFLEFPTIWLRASFHQTDGVFGKQTAWFTESNNLIHFFVAGFNFYVEKKRENNG